MFLLLNFVASEAMSTSSLIFRNLICLWTWRMPTTSSPALYMISLSTFRASTHYPSNFGIRALKAKTSCGFLLIICHAGCDWALGQVWRANFREESSSSGQKQHCGYACSITSHKQGCHSHYHPFQNPKCSGIVLVCWHCGCSNWQTRISKGRMDKGRCCCHRCGNQCCRCKNLCNFSHNHCRGRVLGLSYLLVCLLHHMTHCWVVQVQVSFIQNLLQDSGTW